MGFLLWLKLLSLGPLPLSPVPVERVVCSGLTCSKSGSTLTITSSGGGGGGGNFVEASVVLAGPYTESSVSAAWATATSKVVCAAFPNAADGLTPETVAVAGLQATAQSGSGSFTLRIYSPHGLTGTVRFHCTGG